MSTPIEIQTLQTQAIELEAYFRRIGFEGKPTVSLDTLQALHQSHATAIAYENLDIFLERPIELEPARLMNKLVYGKRGGYCFEMNGLFAAVLIQLGFQVTFLQARVWYRQNRTAESPPFRNHLVLLVSLADKSWLADVGFGGSGLTTALPFIMDAIDDQVNGTFRLIQNPRFGYMLQSCFPEVGWQDMYSFHLTPNLYPTDYVQSNYHTSHSPDSWFTQTQVCTLIQPDGRLVLQDGHLKQVRRNEIVLEETITSGEAYQRILQEHFHLNFSLEEARQLYTHIQKA